MNSLHAPHTVSAPQPIAPPATLPVPPTHKRTSEQAGLTSNGREVKLQKHDKWESVRNIINVTLPNISEFFSLISRICDLLLPH